MRKYENIELLHENTLKPRSHYIPYDTLEKALEGDKSKSNIYTLLNGEWDFAYFSRDIDCPEIIENWDKVKVPYMMQMARLQICQIRFCGMLKNRIFIQL